MVENLIAGYLAGGKRLVIPDLGAFLRKDTGETVFIEFLKKDDGVLAGLVAAARGLSALEAASAVLQFSADVKLSLGARGFYIVPGVGTLRRDAAGAIQLTANPDVQAAAADPVAQKPAPTVDIEPLPADTGASRTDAPPQGAASVINPRPASPAGGPTTGAVAPGNAPSPETVTPRPAVKPAAVPVTDPAPKSPAAALQGADTGRTAAPRPRPKPAVETYGTHFPGRSAAGAHTAPGGKRKKADMVMIVAVVAALIAIGAMVYGLTVNTNPINNLTPTQPQVVEQPVDTADDGLD